MLPEALSRIEVVFITLALYAALVSRSQQSFAFLKMNKVINFEGVLFLHNFLLIVYSTRTFHLTLNLMLQHQSLCDKQHFFETKLQPIAFTFLASKYYELLDTLFLKLKGRPISSLHIFHHVGAIFCVWLIIRAKMFGIWVFILLNSFVHSWMYLYYLLCVLGLTSATWKKSVTILQMLQLFIGLPLSACYYSLVECETDKNHSNMLTEWLFISTENSHFLVAFIFLIYVFILNLLFFDFYIKSY